MSLGDLVGFARRCLDAQAHPGDYHRFTVFRCSQCGVQPLALTLDHHTGSTRGDFKGTIVGRCSSCGREERVFSFTGEHRTAVREERPVCSCGHADFLAGMLERMEGARGLAGFFDEGVIVGECVACGRHTAFVYTD